jgi:hypothetical protein
MTFLAIRTENWAEISKHLEQGTQGNEMATTVLLWVVAGLCVLLLTLMVTRYIRDARTRYRPTSVYMRVAKSMGLGLIDRLWLIRVAKRQGLGSPLTLLMSPGTLTHHASQFLASLSEAESRHMTQRLRMIRHRLFEV